MDRAASVGVGVAMMGVVWGVYQQALPTIVDQRSANPMEAHSTAAEKTARWTSAALVGVVSLVTFDATVFILGGTAVIAFSWMYRHANMGVDSRGPDSTPRSRNHASVASVEANVGSASVGAGIGY